MPFRRAVCAALPLAALAPAAPCADPSDKPAALRALADLVGDGEDFRAIPFGEVVLTTTGHRAIPIDPANEHDSRLLEMLGPVLDGALAALNAPDSPAKKLARINEASRLFEDEILRRINAVPGWTCRTPPTISGETQRSGYPDLEIVEKASGRVTYLDPKLFAGGSAESSFRSFYYEPKGRTGKITSDARHLIAGISHDGHDGGWRFTGWKLVDVSALPVKLKAEFQASNREMYSLPATAESRAEK